MKNNINSSTNLRDLRDKISQLNELIEQGYQKSIQNQTEYNGVIQDSIRLLQEQTNLVKELGRTQNNLISNFDQNNDSSFINPINKSKSIGGGEDDLNIELKDIAEGILVNVDNIWEKLSSINTPIPVEVVNTPLSVIFNDNQNGGGTNINGGSGGSNVVNNRAQNRGGGGANLNAMGRGFNVAASSVSDPNYISAGLVSMIPVVGVGLAAILSKAIGEAEQRVRSAAVFRGATGGNMPFFSLHELGIKDAEAYKREAQYYPANIKLDISDLQFEKGYNVSSGTIDSLLRVMREDIIQRRFGSSSSELGVTFLNQLKESQIDSEKIRGYTEEYLKILIDLNRKQLETTGETNSLISGQIVENIAKTSSRFDDPTILSRVVGSIRDSLINAPSPQTEALQYWAMSQANPNASIWEMQLMKEDPFGERSRGYFSNYLGALLQTGNADDVRFNVMNALGLSARQTEEFLYGKREGRATGILSSKEEAEREGREFDLTQFIEGYNLNNLSSFESDARNQISQEAGRATAENEIMLAKAADRLADLGEPFLEYTSKAIEKSGEILDTITNFFENGFTQGLYAVGKEIFRLFSGGSESEPKSKNVSTAGSPFYGTYQGKNLGVLNSTPGGGILVNNQQPNRNGKK